MKKYLLVLTLTLFFISASSKQPIPLAIVPLIDTMSIKNGSTPATGYYYLEGFQQNKEKIKALFQLIEQDIFPITSTTEVIRLVASKYDVTFDDGVAFLDENLAINIFIQVSESKQYQRLFVAPNKLSPFKFKAHNKQNYKIETQSQQTTVSFAYDSFSLTVLQHFLNIVFYEYQQQEKPIGTQTYQLINSTSNTLDCEITLLAKTAQTGTAYSTLRLRFPDQ